MKMVSSPAAAREESPATPLIGIISPPADYRDVINDRVVRAEQVDVVSRLMFMQQMHKTYAGRDTSSPTMLSGKEASPRTADALCPVSWTCGSWSAARRRATPGRRNGVEPDNVRGLAIER